MSENSADALVNRIIMHITSLFIDNPNYTNNYFTDQYYGKYEFKRDVIQRAEKLIELINEWRPMVREEEEPDDECACDQCSGAGGEECDNCKDGIFILPESKMGQGVLEQIIDDMIDHSKEHPDHGIGCACMDKHATAIRALLFKKLENAGPAAMLMAQGNLKRVLNYIVRS